MLQELAILLLVGDSFAQVNFDFDRDHDLMATDSRISEVQGDIRSLRQVNFEFDAGEDLLAVDSSLSNEIEDFPRGRKISPPPPSFRKIGDRLATKSGRVGNRGLSKNGKRFPPALVSSKREKDGYTFSYRTEDGQKRREKGKVNSGSMVTRGGWEYVGNDGRLYKTEFIADELGYRPVGEHIHPAFVQMARQAKLLAERRRGGFRAPRQAGQGGHAGQAGHAGQGVQRKGGVRNGQRGGRATAGKRRP